MKVLLVNQAFYPDVVSSAQHLTDFAEALVRKGAEVTVLCARRRYDDPVCLHPSREQHNGIHIIRVNSVYLGRQSKVSRTLEALCLNIAFAVRMCFLPRFDRVVALTSPPLVGWIAALCAKIKKSAFFYWVMDINPDQAIEAGWIKKNSLHCRFLEKVLQHTLDLSTGVVVLDRFMKQRIIDKGTSLSKIKVIAPWAHDADLEWKDQGENPFRKKYGLEDKFVVMYSGNHSICHPLDTLLKAAVSLQHHPDIVFVFVGGGVRVRDVLEVKENAEVENILHIPYQNRSDLKYSLRAADLHVISMGEPYVGIVHPCKIYNILSVSRPFLYIGPEASHIQDILASTGMGSWVRHGDVDSAVKTILDARQLTSGDRKKAAEANEEPSFAGVSQKQLAECLTELVMAGVLEDDEQREGGRVPREEQA